MTLTGLQLSRLHQAILPAYTYDELRRVVMAGMNVDTDHLVSPKKAYSDQVFEFVTWADRQGRALELLHCAAEGNARNAGLQMLWAEAQGWDDAPVQPPKTPEPGVAPAAPHHVFLAYSSKDAEFMRQLRRDLLAVGIVAWIAGDDLEVGGTQWQQTIEAAIRAAQCVVVIMTPAAKQSEWVNIEISRARRIGRRIFPVLARGDEDDAVPLILETTNYVDVRKDYNGSVQGRLIPALRKNLEMADVAKPALPEKAESAKPAAAAAGPTIVVPKPAILKPFPIAFEWITIPAGEFLMGSDKKKDKQALDNETPQHTLNLGEFRIARYPVTNAQYLEFVRTTKYKAPEHWKGGAIPTGKEQHPVVNVTWKDVQAFCQWANVRSPSEAEWEKAARGTDGRIWPWGNDAPTKEHCNFGMNVGDTTPVGKYLKGASPYGVMDMAGNVWEWTGSLYKPYPYRADDGRENPEGDGTRTLRGGSWGFDVDLVRCVFRNRHYPWLRNVGVGFRVVSPGY